MFVCLDVSKISLECMHISRSIKSNELIINEVFTDAIHRVAYHRLFHVYVSSTTSEYTSTYVLEKWKIYVDTATY